MLALCAVRPGLSADVVQRYKFSEPLVIQGERGEYVLPAGEYSLKDLEQFASDAIASDFLGG